MKTGGTLAITIACLLAACASEPAGRFQSVSASHEQLDVLEVCFRHVFASNHSAKQGSADRYCVKINGSDPDQKFLGRFRDLPHHIREGSQFRPGCDLMFEMTVPELVEPGLYKVSGGYYEGDLSSSSAVFEVKRNAEGRWTVELWSRSGDDATVEVTS